MNLDDLRAAQVDERGTDSLQPLRPSFYEDAAEYLADLRERRDRLAEQVDDPFDSEEVRQLTDELETAEEVVEAIYDRRVGKLVKRASLEAAGMSTEQEGLTDEERALFSDLVDRIESNRTEVLDALEGSAEPPAVTDESAAEPAPEPPTESPAADGLGADEVMGSGPPGESDEGPPTEESPTDEQTQPDGGAPAAMEESAGEPDRLTVRITAEVGEIYGVDDRVYTLDTEDVVTLPTPNAKPLLERGAAQQLD